MKNQEFEFTEPKNLQISLDTPENLHAILESILFASGEPVKIQRFCEILNLDRAIIEQSLQDLMDMYSYERRGIRLLHLEDSWQMCSSPEYTEYVQRTLEIRRPAKLSQPALEALAVIAYEQPTTRTRVEQLRGVDSAYTIGLLLDRNLIEPCGRLQVPGRPRLYRTTEQFLRSFHLQTLEDLPPLPDSSSSSEPEIPVPATSEEISREREESS